MNEPCKKKNKNKNVSDNGRMLYVLADDFISYHIFDKETNDWEKSSLKDWLNDYKEQVFDKESHYYFEPEDDYDLE